MKKKYDYIIVGAGLYGAICAYELNKRGYKCLVIDKRNHIGGNCFTENIEGINVHKYGAHIFHTNDKDIWNYVNKFINFNRYTNSPIANFKGKLYNLPFNMNTFYQLWGVTTPEQAKDIINNQIKSLNINDPQNLEEQALALVGFDIYNKLIKGYTEKQWGRSATELPAFIIKRLPLRFTFDNNYFNDNYQGIPIGGYSELFSKLLQGVELELNCDYFDNKVRFDGNSENIIYTGPIDKFYDYKYGKLEYRSLIFETNILEIENFQGNAVMNFTDKDTPFTRIIEHKHFEFGTQNKTVVTKEYSKKTSDLDEPFYPINDSKNNRIYQMYLECSQKENNVFFGGRLAEYKYYDMHQVIGVALNFIKKNFNE